MVVALEQDGVGGDAPDGNGESSEEAPGPDLMDLTDAPGVEYLAPAERQLCSELHLLPGYYLVVKVSRGVGGKGTPV